MKEFIPKKRNKLSRTDKARFLHYYLEPTNGKGLEIGPYVRPIVSRKKGFDVESCDTRTLRKRAQERNHDPSLVQDVDYVSSGSLLADIGSEKNSTTSFRRMLSKISLI